MELDSLAEDSSCPCSVSLPANPGFQDTAPPQSQDLQGGAASQPRQPPGVDPTPLEGGGHQAPVGHAEAGGSPLHDQTPGGAVPNAKEHDNPTPSKASGLPQEGAGPTASASKDHPGKDGAAWQRPMPDSEPGSEPQKEPQSAGQQAGARAPGVSRWGIQERAYLP